MMFKFILAALTSLPIWTHDRAPELAEQKAAQQEKIAHSIREASKSPGWPGSRQELEALLLAVGHWESTFALHIGEGRCGPHECDRGRDGEVRAAGFWQIHIRAASSPEAWEAAKTDIAVAAREAARALTRARNMCRSLEGQHEWLPMVLSSYAGRSCRGTFKGLELRVATYKRVIARLRGRT